MLIELGNPIFNESTSALGSSAVYTGSARQSSQVTPVISSRYNNFNVQVITDQASAANGLQIQWSQDGSTNWRTIAQVAVVASTPITLSVPITFPYYRTVLTNGGTAQGSLSITSSFTL